MDVIFLVAEIEEFGVRFRVERFHVDIEGREQTVIAIDYPTRRSTTSAMSRSRFSAGADARRGVIC